MQKNKFTKPNGKSDKSKPLKVRLILVDGLSDEERQDRLDRIAEALFDSTLRELRGGEVGDSK